jgi:hypothetical protein
MAYNETYKGGIMAAALAPVARFMVKLTITVVWALVLSKLIRSLANLAKKLAQWTCVKVATAKS